MPFSFSNIGSTALIFMVACLVIARVFEKLRHRSGKKVSGDPISE